MKDGEQTPLTIYRLSKIIFVRPVFNAGLGTMALWYVWTANLNLMDNLGQMVLGVALYESFYPKIFLSCRIVTAIVAMNFALHVLMCLIRYKTTELKVFSNRVLWRTGFITRSVFTTSVQEIIGVQLTQSIPGRMLGFGSISISTRGDDQIVAELISRAPQASSTIMALKNNLMS